MDVVVTILDGTWSVQVEAHKMGDGKNVYVLSFSVVSY